MDGVVKKHCRFCNAWFKIPGDHWIEVKSTLGPSFTCKTHQKKWHSDYSKKNRAKINARLRRLVKENPEYKLRYAMGTRLHRFIKGTEGKCRYLPYTMYELKTHLQSLFKPNMSWDNYGKWHIDHVIPLKAKKKDGAYYWNQVKLSNPKSDDFKKAWSLNNLQPLWAEENYRKHNKYASR